MAKSKEFIEGLPDKAWEYIQECMKNTSQKATHSGKIVNVKDRHIPTIGYFLEIWLPMNWKEDQEINGQTITRSTWYEWLHIVTDGGEPNIKSDTIKKIDEKFKQLATDIVANEGKGIFYAKNRLGMTDKFEHATNKEQPLFGKDVNE